MCSSDLFLVAHVSSFLSALSIVWGFVGLTSLIGGCLAAMKPKLLNKVFINDCCKELLLVLSRPSFALDFVLWLTSLSLASEFKYLFHFLSVFCNWARSIQFPFWEMNIIIWYIGFREAGVEFVANVAKVWEIREV